MPQCSSCGNKGFRLVLYACRVCGRAGCENCMQNWKFLYQDLRPSEVVCSPQCFWQWVEGVFPAYRSSGLGEFTWATGLHTDVVNILDMKIAKQYEREGNYGEAKRIYTFYYMDDEVQRVDALIASQKNEMIQKFKSRGGWVTLVCPKCGAINRIGPEMREETMRSCFSCGTEYEDGTFVFLLKKALEEPSAEGDDPASAAPPGPPEG